MSIKPATSADGVQPVAQEGVSKLPQLLQRAALHHGAGELTAAEQCFREVLALQPDQADALAGLGALAGQQGDMARAIPYLERACALQPSVALFQHNHGEALRQAGRLALAEAALRRAVALEPSLVPAWSSLVSVVQMAHAQALVAHDAARATMLASELARLLNNKGNALLASGNTDDAIASYRHALNLREDYAMAWSNLGNSLRQQGLVSEAEAACRRAIAIDDTFAPAWNNLGNALVEQGRHDEGQDCYAKALQHQSDFAEALHNRGSGSLFNRLFSSSISDAELLEAHRAWGKAWPAPAERKWANTRNPERTLRIGYLSPDFREHAMRHFIEPLLAHHRAAQVELVCYAQGPRADAHTRRLMDYGHRWTWIHGLDDAALAMRIERDAVDILVDCAGHTHGTRLTALAGKPAPIMMSWLGYLHPTGLPAMDYRLSDAWVDPLGAAESDVSESVLRIPGGMLCYRPHAHSPEPNELPCLSRGHVTFGSLNNTLKLNRVIVADWAHLLASVPDSRLLLQSRQLCDAGVVGRIRGMFEAFGIAPARLDLRPASPDFLRSYHEVDVALDTYPYGGGATTCDALWMGVPVITRSGTRAAGRLTTSILQLVGHPEWITESSNATIVGAIELARKPRALAQLRQGLRAQMQASALCDEQGFVQRLEGVYRAAWLRWLG
ncbi:MAG: tetratricopeptide repeat protein [Burkholderiaceae bacterium]